MYTLDHFIQAFRENLWLISRILFELYLLLLSVMDLRTRRLNLVFLFTGIVPVIAGLCSEREIHPVLLLTGGGVGLVFLLASRITKEAFGYGDSILILIMGCFLGFWDLMSVLAAAFLVAAAFSAVMLWRKKFSRRSAFPFVPFLAAAYTGGMLFGIFG